MADEQKAKGKKNAIETLALDSEKQKEFEDKVKSIKSKVRLLEVRASNFRCSSMCE
jgi:hypothetical protein